MSEGMHLDDLPVRLNEISRDVVLIALAVHGALGPGLLERVWTLCLRAELERVEVNEESVRNGIERVAD